MRFEADASELISELDRAKDAILAGFNPAVDAATSYALKFNEEMEVTQGTIKQTVGGFTNLTVGLKATEEGFRLASVAVQRNDDALKNSLSNIQRAIDYRKQMVRAIQQEKDELDRTAKAAQREHEIRARNAAAAGASLGGSGSISFTSLGRSLFAPSASLGANFAIGAVAGAATAGMEKFVHEIEAGAERSEKFELSLARLGAITRDNATTTDLWRDKIIALSNQFNIKNVEVLGAAYEGVSRGALSGARNTEVLEESLKLAKVTGGDSAAAMRALNDILSVYGNKAGDVKKNSELLFQAVKNGGGNLDELGSSLSRVTALAAPMGVSVEEIVAALDVMRSKGISTSLGVAGLAQILAELEKPSHLAKEALSQLGFANGQAAVATLGMMGAIRAVSEQVQKNGHDVAELFPNIRAMRTEFLLTGEGMGQFEEALKRTKAATGELDAAVTEVTSASGQRWSQMVTEWDNRMQKYGLTLNDVKDKIADVVNTPLDVLDNTIQTKGEAGAFAAGRAISAPPDASREQAAALASARNALLKNISDSRAAKDAANKEDLKAMRENSATYVEELKKRVEATRDAEFKMKDAFASGALSRALKTATPDQAKALIEARVEQLKSQENDRLAHLDSLRGKSFLESKDPAEVERLESEILKLREMQAEKALQQATTDSDRLRIEEELKKNQEEQLQVEERLAAINLSHQKTAEGLVAFSQTGKGIGQAVENLTGGSIEEQFAAFQQVTAAVGTAKTATSAVGALAGFSGKPTGFAPAELQKYVNTLDVAGTATEGEIRAIFEVTRSLTNLSVLVDGITIPTLAEAKAKQDVRDTTAAFLNAGRVLGFSEGGHVPGPTDTVPAMLTPGEFVVNARAARSFAPLLEAINHGKGFADGGSVTNVGDINITVKGGPTGSATVEDIGRGLRRALRRRVIRLD